MAGQGLPFVDERQIANSIKAAVKLWCRTRLGVGVAVPRDITYGSTEKQVASRQRLFEESTLLLTQAFTIG
jgi:hypothetical protein